MVKKWVHKLKFASLDCVKWNGVREWGWKGERKEVDHRDASTSKS